MQRQDESLLNRLRKGERKAMEELYDNYAPVLLGVALRYCDCKEDAEDQLHESLLKILNGINGFKPSFDGAFEVWMRRVTVNQCLSAMTRKRDFRQNERINDNEFFEPMGDDQIMDNLPDLNPEQIVEMMQSLPIGYRTVLNMYVFEQMSHKEIANKLNITENTSKTQLLKARNSMKKKLGMMMTKKEATG